MLQLRYPLRYRWCHACCAEMINELLLGGMLRLTEVTCCWQRWLGTAPTVSSLVGRLCGCGPHGTAGSVGACTRRVVDDAARCMLTPARVVTGPSIGHLHHLLHRPSGVVRVGIRRWLMHAMGPVPSGVLTPSVIVDLPG